jgi:hypothetical protein
MEVYESRQLLPIGDVSLSHDSHLNRDLSLVARSATEEFSALFSLDPPAGIRPVTVLYRAEGPQTNSTKDTARYKVYLNVNQWHPEQLVYQLGHELCHILADPRRTNWFVESCCAMASTVLLCRMSRLPPNDPPNRRSPNFRQYAQDVIRRARQADQPDARQGQVLNAEILRPLFDQSLENWNALCFLGRASTSPPAHLKDWDPHALGFTFDRWLHAVPSHFKAIVQRISRIPEDRWDYRVDCRPNTL